MKIRELRFKNLNALMGEWCIDFTHPAYTTEGVFALTGKTGAGKSTILDAICLALYGATPRLGKITKSTNEMMSRQTGECYAEVVFESQEGVFRCHFEQRRARKQADAKLQEPEHSIACAKTSKLIETKKSLVLLAIEEKTGMDFERFTRSMLLAQGDFDAFLRADAEQKSKILEQITGTDIYTKISQQTHERLRFEKEQLLTLKSQTDGLNLLEEKEINQLIEQRDTLNKNLKSNAHEVKQTETAINWHKTIIELKNELQTKTLKEQELNHKIAAFQDKKQILHKANQALTIEPAFASLNLIRQLQAANISKEQELKNLLPSLQLNQNKELEILSNLESALTSAKTNLKNKLPLFQKIRAIDNKIIEKNQRLQELFDIQRKESLAIESNQKKRLNLENQYQETEQAHQQSINYIFTHKQDKWLISGLTGLTQQLFQLKNHQIDLENHNKKLKDLYVSRENMHEKYDICHQELTKMHLEITNIRQAIQKEQEQLNLVLNARLLREYRQEKDGLLRELAYVKKIESLEAERDKLQSGQPCPLCGAKEHPFVNNSTPKPNAIEEQISLITQIITKAEILEAKISTYSQHINQANEKLNEKEQSLKHIVFEQQQLEKEITEHQQQHQKIQDSLEALIAQLHNQLIPLGINIKENHDIDSIIKELQKRQNQWQKQEQLAIKNEQMLNQISVDIKHLNTTLLNQSKSLDEQLISIEGIQHQIKMLTKERQDDFEDKSPDTEEQAIYKDIEQLESGIIKQRDNHQHIKNQMLAIDTQIKTLALDIKHRLPIIKQQEEQFKKTLAQSGFINEEDFLQSRLSLDERNHLSTIEKTLNDAKTRLHGQIHQLQEKLHLETEKNLSPLGLDELNMSYQQQEALQKKLTEDISTIQHVLTRHEQAKSILAEKQQLIETQEKECFRFEKLHTLIGSADGKKYRNFAQGLTFELVIHHANHQLKKLSDRYILIHNREEPLSLSVIDQYQAGDIRSTKNLSGGERFIVSLALALGLSKMSSQNVRVDSLFLDEGFGTLDDDSLEIALDALAELHQSGKLIGIISHVAALKERISTQINIIPISPGKSKIAGLGCSEIKR